jgi:hypothetical protein
MLVRNIVNDEVILEARECPRTHFYTILTKALEVHTIYTLWQQALRLPSHDLMKYVNIVSNGDLIPSKLTNFDCNSCLQSKPIYTILKTLLDQAKLKFDIIHSDMHGTLAIQSLGRKRYCVTFIDEFS